jgi:hypothetical protein
MVTVLSDLNDEAGSDTLGDDAIRHGAEIAYKRLEAVDQIVSLQAT